MLPWSGCEELKRALDIPRLRHYSTSHGKAKPALGNLPENGSNPLGAAILHVGRDAQSDGGEPFELRRNLAIIQRRNLVKWAHERNLLIEGDFQNPDATIGGSEHDVWIEDGEVWKLTRPDHFGWTVLAGADGKPESTHATPLEYLQRWQCAEQYFGDRIVIRAVIQSDCGVRSLISHPFIKGPHAAREQILSFMKQQGFQRISGFSVGAEPDTSFFHPAANIALFDAASDNFIVSHGIPIPVDLLTLMPGHALRSQLLALLNP